MKGHKESITNMIVQFMDFELDKTFQYEHRFPDLEDTTMDHFRYESDLYCCQILRIFFHRWEGEYVKRRLNDLRNEEEWDKCKNKRRSDIEVVLSCIVK